MRKNRRFLIHYLGLLVLLFSVSLSSFAQQTICGNVIDSDGLPLPGATVLISSTAMGTITDIDGAYTINAPSNAELKFSFVGMIDVIVKIGGKTTINVTLKPDAINIEEVVVVGYGTQKRSDVTGAVSSIAGNKIAGLGTFSAAQALQGKMSGVTVLNNGDAGSNAKIRIRGINTVGNNDPLIVIDGVTNGGSINDIHPSDIESIDVLKDASALAIYGSRASSGVILITTKKGKYGAQKMQVRLDASYGISNVFKRLDLVNCSEKVDMIDEARRNENAMRGNNAYRLYDEIWPEDNWGRQDITDWQDELFNQRTVQDYSLSAQGGSEHSTYAFSTSYRNEEGILPKNFAKRLTVRGNYETKVLNDKLKLGAIMSFTTREKQGSEQIDIWTADLFEAAKTPGNISAYKDGKAYQETDPKKTAFFMPGDLYQNNTVVWNDYSNPEYNFVNQLYADLEILKGLHYKITFSQNYGSNFSRDYKISSKNPEGGQSTLAVSGNSSKSFSLDNVLSFDKKIRDFNLNLVAGTNIIDSRNNGLYGSRVSFPEGDIEALRYLGYGLASSQTNGESAGASRLASYFGRANISYKDRYLLTATVRQDGSSRFHENVRWGTFPSASLGWRISEENFMKSISWLNMLKARISWGQVGNQNVGNNYAYLSTVRNGYLMTWGTGDTDYALGTNSERNTGKVIWNRGNENVTWETTTILNAGLDFSLLGFNGSFEIFKNNTTDILLDAQFPDIAGYYPGTSQKVNSGEIETKGFDFSLNYAKSIEDFNFSVGVNITYSDNEIISLAKNEFISTPYAQEYKGIMGKISRSYVGDPVGSFYGYNAIGIFNTQTEVDAANAKAREFAAKAAISTGKPLTDAQLVSIYYISPLTAPGDRIFEDRDGDGRITSKDEMNLGCGNPKFQFGLNLSADYKGFDLTANFSGSAGVQVYSMFEPALSLPGQFNSLSSIKDHWTPTNGTNNFPRYTMSDPNGNGRASNIWIHDASYIRLQNLVLGYTVPSKLISKIGLTNLRLFTSVQNLFTITKYPFLEPEVISNEAAIAGDGNVDVSAGVDVGTAPLPCTFMFGLNVNF